MPLDLHIFQASLERKARWFFGLFQADYWDQDPIHVAHRSLKEERRQQREAHRRQLEVAAAWAAEEGDRAGEAEGDEPEGREPPEYQDSMWIKIFLLLDEPNFSKESKYMSIFLCGVVVLSCFSYLLGTMENFKYIPKSCHNPICVPGPDAPCTHTVCFPQPRPAIYNIEVFSMIVFTIDYLVRVACVHAVPYRLIHPEDYVKGYLADHPEPNGLTKTLSYMLSFLNLVDLAAIVPFYAQFFVHHLRANLVFLRLLRLLRVVRVFKLGRYSEGHAILHETFVASVPALLIMLFFMLVVTLLFGALIFYCEEGTFKVTEEYPEGAYFRPSNAGGEEVSPFKSIPAACYWVVMTATTVGYGDFYPVTALGRIIAVIVAYSGIVSIALPVTIIGKHFTDVYFEFKEKASQEKAKAEAEAATRAALAAASAPLQVQSKEQNGDKAVVLINEDALTAAIQRQLNSVPTVAGAAIKGGSPASDLPSPSPPPAAAATAIEWPARFENGSAPPAAAAAPQQQHPAEAAGTGLRRRAALTGLIREQLMHMDATMRTLAARLEELESIPQ